MDQSGGVRSSVLAAFALDRPRPQYAQMFRHAHNGLSKRYEDVELSIYIPHHPWRLPRNAISISAIRHYSELRNTYIEVAVIENAC